MAEILGVDALVNNESTRNALLSLAQGADVVHVATHGFLDNDTPDDSFVALADGRITVHDLQHGAGLQVGLIVISACRTGAGLANPDSVLGLTTAYRDLSKGHDLATALRTAQLEAIHSAARGRPENWAAFRLTGSSANPLARRLVRPGRDRDGSG